jgi:hypothetical protein
MEADALLLIKVLTIFLAFSVLTIVLPRAPLSNLARTGGK